MKAYRLIAMMMATVIACTALSTTAAAQHRNGGRNNIEMRGGHGGNHGMNRGAHDGRHHDVRMGHRMERHDAHHHHYGHPVVASHHHHYNIHDRWHRGFVHHHGDVFRYLPCEARRCVVNGMVVYSLLDLIFRPIMIDGVVHYMID